jgi:hypothetical protein
VHLCLCLLVCLYGLLGDNANLFYIFIKCIKNNLKIKQRKDDSQFNDNCRVFLTTCVWKSL